MSQITLEKLNKNVSEIKKEVKNIHSFIIGILGKDKEGEYRPEFVKKILNLSAKKADFIFKNSKNFLKQIRQIS